MAFGKDIRFPKLRRATGLSRTLSKALEEEPSITRITNGLCTTHRVHVHVPDVFELAFRVA